MTYSDLLDRPAERGSFLVRISPKQLITGWTFHANSTFDASPIYRAQFQIGAPVFIGSYDDIGDQKVGPNYFPYTAFTSSSAGALALNYWTFDPSTGYVYAAFVGLPTTTNFYGFYELYYASEDLNFDRDPSGDSSRLAPIQMTIPGNAQYNYDISDVYWSGSVIQSPSYVTGSTTDIFGIVPSQGGTLSIEGVSGDFLAHARVSSFSDALVDVYHWLGDPAEDNIARILSARMRSYTIGESEVSFQLADKLYLLDASFRQNYASEDPANAYNQKVLQKIYGRVDGVQAFQLSPYPSGDPDRWFIADRSDFNPTIKIARTVAVSPASTTTRTYLNSVAGFEVGDTFHASDTGGGFTFTSGEVTAVNRVSNYIDHTALAAALASGKLVDRYYISYLYVIQDDASYRARVVRDYAVIAGQPYNIEWDAAAQANLVLPDPINYQTSKISGRIYGPRKSFISTALNALSWISNDSITDTIANPVAIMLQVVLNALYQDGTSNVDLIGRDVDLDSFEDAYNSFTLPVGVAISESFGTGLKSAKSIVEEILPTGFFTLYLNEGGKIALSFLAPLGAADYSLDETDIVFDSQSYSFDHQDMASQVLVTYNRQALSPDTLDSAYPTITVANEVAGELYGLTGRSKTFDTVFIQEADATEYATKVGGLLSEPHGLLHISTKNKLMKAKVGQVVELNIEKLPGFEYVPGTMRTRKFRIAEITKSSAGVELTLDDQKGIEDNSGDW